MEKMKKGESVQSQDFAKTISEMMVDSGLKFILAVADDDGFGTCSVNGNCTQLMVLQKMITKQLGE